MIKLTCITIIVLLLLFISCATVDNTYNSGYSKNCHKERHYDKFGYYQGYTFRCE